LKDHFDLSFQDSEMRIRITRALRGSIDGIQLSRLVKGRVYDVYTSLACYLLSEEMAEPANGESSAASPIEKNGVQQRPAEMREGTVLPRSMAADRRRIRKHTKRKEHS
jgi:hypothetical protein